MQQISNYIAGGFQPAAGGAWIEDFDPALGVSYALVPDSDARDVETAVAAARAAFPAWSAMPAERRSDLLLDIARRIEADIESLSRAESIDGGKPVWLARELDIPRAALNFRFFATAILHFASEAHATDERALNITLRRPVGIAGCISPWNLPLYLFTWKIAPALAAGNCVVAKPSEITPMTAFLLSKICMDAGLPPGVLNIVHGYGAKAGSAIVGHPDIAAVSFTGGTRTGAAIAAAAAPMFKKLSLELGGKNPTIVFADSAFDTMIETVLRSSFLNQGEICLCGSRILVERPLYDRFLAAFIPRVQSLTVGDPLSADTQQGALVSKQHLEKVRSAIELATAEGGRILCGGHTVHPGGRCANGWFIAPTVIEGLPPACRTNQEEIFGPVVTVQPFDTEEEAIAIANGTPYGLASSVWTEHLTRAHRVANGLQTGIVWINCWMLRDLRTPFGGMKQSGVGREGGWDALRFFTESKNVCIQIT